MVPTKYHTDAHEKPDPEWLAKLAIPVEKTVAFKLLPALGMGAASALDETGVKKMFGSGVNTSGVRSKGLAAKVPHNKIPILVGLMGKGLQVDTRTVGQRTECKAGGKGRSPEDAHLAKDCK